MTFYTFLRNPNGNRYTLYLYRDDDGSWNWNYNWLDNDRNASNPALGFATLFISPILRRGFVFESVHANRRVVCQLSRAVLTMQYIF